MLRVVLLGFEAESEDEKKSRDQRDRLDGARARIAVRRSSEELRRARERKRKWGTESPLAFFFYEARRGFL